MKVHRDDYLLNCPFCFKKMWFSNIKKHRRKEHKTKSLKDFEYHLITLILCGKIKPKFFANPDGPGNRVISGTQALSRAGKHRSFQVRAVVQGGKVSPN